MRVASEEQLRRLVRAGEDDGVDVGMGDEATADRRRRRSDQLQDVGGTPAAGNCRDEPGADATASGAGLRMTALPAASAAATPPAGMAYGKFHGAATTHGAERPARRRGREHRRRACVCVAGPAGEVDRLRHLGVALAHGLRRFRTAISAIVAAAVGAP